MVNSIQCIGRSPRKMNVNIRGEAVEQVDRFRYLENVRSYDMRCSREVKIRIAMAKKAFNKGRNIFFGYLDKELRKRLVKCFVQSVVLYGAETWTLRRSEEKRVEAFEMLV